MRSCKVEGCEKRYHCKGYCNMHYSRFVRHGDPNTKLPVGPKPFPKIPCSIEGCERVISSRGWCQTHYQHWRRYGTPHGARSWGSYSSYAGWHNYLNRQLGPARERDCFFGLHPADEWAFLKELCDEAQEDKDGPFCNHFEHYAPICRSHHRKMDGLFDKREGLGLAGMWNEIAIAEIPGEVIA